MFRGEVLNRSSFNSPLKRRKKTQLRRRILGVSRDQVVCHLRKRCQMSIQSRMITAEHDVDRDARRIGEWLKTLIEGIVRGARNQSYLQRFSHLRCSALYLSSQMMIPSFRKSNESPALTQADLFYRRLLRNPLQTWHTRNCSNTCTAR